MRDCFDRNALVLDAMGDKDRHAELCRVEARGDAM